MLTNKENGLPSLSECIIAIVGLGYVGLPLALAFGVKYPTIGIDASPDRVRQLRDHEDINAEHATAEFIAAKQLQFVTKWPEVRDANIYIVTVPTPINEAKTPDFSYIEQASRQVAEQLSCGNVVVFESTVYPGAIEEICIPILQAVSGLTFNVDFFVGYSPERINPGDKLRKLQNIVKVTSGSTPESAQLIDKLYASIVTAGTHLVSSIKAAEAAKVIENTQRDLNIALINELAIIFNKLNLDTHEILDAAATKWNFMPFSPGLVGGHCIGVDPYYLTYKAEAIGYYPEVILAGRRINDRMGEYVASCIVKTMLLKKLHVKDAEILLLGFTFKENCSDCRNTKVIDIIRALQEYGAKVKVFDPLVVKQDAYKEVDWLTNLPETADFAAIVLAVKHQEFLQLGIDRIRALGGQDHIIYDVKNILPANLVDGRL